MANAINTSSRRSAESSTAALFVTVREAQEQQLQLGDPHEHARARARLLQALEPQQAGVREQPKLRQPVWRWFPARETGLRWALGGLAVAACAFAILITLPDRDPQNLARDVLEFRIDGAELGVMAPVLADEHPRAIVVSDGTRIELASHGRMFVGEARPNGATVVLEDGEVSLAVHHEHDTSWQVAAGPWTVHVTGTQFVVGWEPSSEHFRVAVSEGSVRVEGPDNDITQLGAGEQLLRQPVEPESPNTVTMLDPVPEPAPAPVEDTAAQPDKPSKASARRWNRYFDDFDYQGAWEALAELPGGIHGEAERVSSAKTMLDLADVARFTKHSSDTRKLLERTRERFPNSHEASEAAFALGRLAADGGSPAKAAKWFELYLDERPAGSFAGDALGRLIDCYDALGQTAEAKSAAKRYLASHPKGPHASKAEKFFTPGGPG